MKQFREYEGEPQAGEDVANEGGAAQLTKAIAAAYNGKSGADIWLKILQEAESAKRAGTLSNEEIDEFFEQFSPMLNPAQRKQLKGIVERLKTI